MIGLCFLNRLYHVADANSYLVVTGGGVEDVKLVRKAWIMPWQKVRFRKKASITLDKTNIPFERFRAL
ncbi:MAG: hypothetical protein Q9167_001865 [Letrouitia subvulpina]